MPGGLPLGARSKLRAQELVFYRGVNTSSAFPRQPAFNVPNNRQTGINNTLMIPPSANQSLLQGQNLPGRGNVIRSHNESPPQFYIPAPQAFEPLLVQTCVVEAFWLFSIPVPCPITASLGSPITRNLGPTSYPL